MGAPDARLDAPPLLVVLRAAGELNERTVQAVEAAVRRQDRVVVAVREGAVAPTGKVALRRLRAEVVTEAAARPVAAAHATAGGVVIVLEDGAHGIEKRWLVELAVAAEAAGGAALAATNAAPWPVCPPDLPDAGAPRTEWRDWVRALADRPAVRVTGSELTGPVVALAPAAAAVWTDAPPTHAGLSPAELAAAAAVAVRAEGTYVHDTRTSVLLSACMIMKDETENLERCLASLLPVVDEVVVYDTGSTDASVALARSLGAVVIEGEWHDDFSLARNAARAHCRGTWLLHVDADEEIEDPRTARDLRSVLDRDVPVDLMALPLHNMMGTELAPVRHPNPHWVPRVVHRTRCHWTGALHEHPMPVRGGQPRAARGPSITLLHYGYLDEVMARRDKAGRNARIAADKLDDVAEAGRSHFDRARTHVMSGRLPDAMTEYALAVKTATNPIHRRCAMEQAALVLLNLGRPDDAEHWIALRETVPDLRGVARWLRARQALAKRKYQRALSFLDGISDYTDHFSTNGEDGLHLMRAQALAGLDRMDEASAEVLAALGLNPAYDPAWLLVVHHADRWPDTVARAAALVPTSQLKLLAAKVLGMPAMQASLVAEGLWAAHPNAKALLALGAQLAPRLELEDAARWAVRLRAANLATHCPLRAIARDPEAAVVDRLQAAYLGAELFADPELAALQAELSALLPAG